MSKGKWKQPELTRFTRCDAIQNCFNKPAYFRRSRKNNKFNITFLCEEHFKSVPTFYQDKFWNWEKLKKEKEKVE